MTLNYSKVLYNKKNIYKGDNMDIILNKVGVSMSVEKEKPAIKLHGTNRSQHRPMSEEYDISYSELKEMEVNDSIDWGTENDDYEVVAMFKDDDGIMVRITTWNTNPWKEEEPEVEVKYFQWI